MEGSALVEQLRARLSQRERDLVEVLVSPRPSTLNIQRSILNIRPWALKLRPYETRLLLKQAGKPELFEV